MNAHATTAKAACAAWETKEQGTRGMNARATTAKAACAAWERKEQGTPYKLRGGDGSYECESIPMGAVLLQCVRVAHVLCGRSCLLGV